MEKSEQIGRIQAAGEDIVKQIAQMTCGLPFALVISNPDDGELAVLSVLDDKQIAKIFRDIAERAEAREFTKVELAKGIEKGR